MSRGDGLANAPEDEQPQPKAQALQRPGPAGETPLGIALEAAQAGAGQNALDLEEGDDGDEEEQQRGHDEPEGGVPRARAHDVGYLGEDELAQHGGQPDGGGDGRGGEAAPQRLGAVLRVDLLQGRRGAGREEVVLAVAGDGDAGEPRQKLLGDGGGDDGECQDEGREGEDHAKGGGRRGRRGGGARVIVTGVFGKRHLHFCGRSLSSRGTIGVGGEGGIERGS